MDIVAVAALGENGVIGDGESLPWSVPEESRRYRERVADDTVVIGRKTYEMYDDLPGKRQIILTRSDRTYDDASVTAAGSVEAAIDLAERAGAPLLYVLGGAGVYEAFLPYCDEMYLSRIEGEHEGDAHFPDFDTDEWELLEETDYEGYAIQHWERVSGGAREEAP